MAIFKTLAMANATGYTLTLVPLGTTKDDFVPTSVRLVSAVNCWVRLDKWAASNIATPAVPTDPTPGTGTSCDFYHLLANEVVEFGVKRLSLFADPSKYGDMDYYQFVEVYSQGAGELKILAQ